jgi:putative transposase
MWQPQGIAPTNEYQCRGGACPRPGVLLPPKKKKDMMKYNPQIHHRRSIRLTGYDYSQAGAYFITICCHDKECRFGKIVVGAGLAPALDNPPAQDEKGQPQGIAPTIALDGRGQPQGIAPTNTSVVGAGFTPALDTSIPDLEPQMELNEYGTIAYNEWVKLPERFPNFELDVFQIMPNHIHAIIVLTPPALDGNGHPQGIAPTNTSDVGAGFTPALDNRPAQDEKGQPQGIAPTDTSNVGAGFTPALDIATTNTTPNNTVSDIVGAYKSLVANACLEIYKSNNEGMGKLWQRNFHDHIIRDEQSYQKIANYIINNPANWKDDKFYRP